MWVLSLLSSYNSASADGRTLSLLYGLPSPLCNGTNTLRERHPNGAVYLSFGNVRWVWIALLSI